MKLFWSSRSPYARKVMVMAHEAGLAEDIETVPVVVMQSGVEHQVGRYNPFMRIPTLVTDDGEVIIDSRTICEYLDSIAVRPVSYPEGRDRLAINRAHAFGEGLMDLGITWLIARMRNGGVVPAEFEAAAREKLNLALDLFEERIDALAGEGFDVAAATIGCALDYFDFRHGNEPWRQGRPELVAWHERFSARPSALSTRFSE